MTGSQILFTLAAAIVLAISIRRWLLIRSVKHYAPGEVAARLKTGRNVQLLDVRTPAERSVRHINGSLHIPLHELRARVDELGKFKDKEIICYCQSGNRSLSAAATLRKHGFDAANMRGGIAGWNFSGLK